MCIFPQIVKDYSLLNPGGSAVKNLPPVLESQETQIQSLGLDEPLDECMATTPVFLLGESHGQRSLVGYSP